MKKRIIIAVLLAISVGAFIYYFTHRTPSDIEVYGDEGVSGIISLATAVVSLATAVVTLAATRKTAK